MEEKKQDHIETLQWLQKQPQHKIKELVSENDNSAWDTVESNEENPDGTDTVGGDNNDENEEKASHLRICPKDSLIWTSGF